MGTQSGSHDLQSFLAYKDEATRALAEAITAQLVRMGKDASSITWFSMAAREAAYAQEREAA
ncbi:MAG: hypothetical protein ACXIUZ_01620 [Lysobacteraceae bacterium]